MKWSETLVTFDDLKTTDGSIIDYDTWKDIGGLSESSLSVRAWRKSGKTQKPTNKQG
jgi:hypothetical protein